MYTKQLLEDVSRVVNPHFFINETKSMAEDEVSQYLIEQIEHLDEDLARKIRIEMLIEEQIQLDENLKKKLATMGLAGMIALGSMGAGYKLGQKSDKSSDIAAAEKNTPRAEMSVQTNKDRIDNEMQTRAARPAGMKKNQSNKILADAASYINDTTHRVYAYTVVKYFGKDSIDNNKNKGLDIMYKITQGKLDQNNLSNMQKDVLAEYLYKIFNKLSNKPNRNDGEIIVLFNKIKDLSTDPAANIRLARKVVDNPSDLNKILNQFSKGIKNVENEVANIKKRMLNMASKVDTPQKLEEFKKEIDSEIEKYTKMFNT